MCDRTVALAVSLIPKARPVLLISSCLRKAPHFLFARGPHLEHFDLQASGGQRGQPGALLLAQAVARALDLRAQHPPVHLTRALELTVLAKTHRTRDTQRWSSALRRNLQNACQRVQRIG
jgi:hypothetical protein